MGKVIKDNPWVCIFGDRSVPVTKGHRDEPDKILVAEPQIHYDIPTTNFANQLILASAADLESLKIPGHFVKQLESATDLDAIQLASILGMSKSKYYRVLKEEVLELNEVDVLASFLKLWKFGINTFDQISEDFDEFLNTTNTNLGRKPIDLLNTENGRREVEKALGRIEYGLYG